MFPELHAAAVAQSVQRGRVHTAARAQRVSYKLGTGALSQGVKRQEREASELVQRSKSIHPLLYTSS
jgi:hypothetical protein